MRYERKRVTTSDQRAEGQATSRSLRLRARVGGSFCSAHAPAPHHAAHSPTRGQGALRKPPEKGAVFLYHFRHLSFPVNSTLGNTPDGQIIYFTLGRSILSGPCWLARAVGVSLQEREERREAAEPGNNYRPPVFHRPPVFNRPPVCTL